MQLESGPLCEAPEMDGCFRFCFCGRLDGFCFYGKPLSLSFPLLLGKQANEGRRDPIKGTGGNAEMTCCSSYRRHR